MQYDQLISALEELLKENSRCIIGIDGRCAGGKTTQMCIRDRDKSFAIQAGREIRVMVVPEQISDTDMVLLARDISKQIEAELEYPGQIKVNVIRESRVIDYAK